MSRTKTRLSRGLIAILLATVVLGSVFYFHRPGKSNAGPASNQPFGVVHDPFKTPDKSPGKSPADARSSAALPATGPSIAPPPSMSTDWNAGSAVVTSTPKFGDVKLIATNVVARTDLPPIDRPRALVAPSTNPAGSSPTTKSSVSFTSAKDVPLTGDPMTDGQARLTAGDLLGARDLYNAALHSGKLSSDDLKTARGKLIEINQTVVFSPKRFPNDPFGGTYSVKPGDRLQSIATQFDVPWELIAKLNGLSDPRKLRAGQTLKVLHGPLSAVVNKSAFTVDLYFGAAGEKGSVYVTTFPVGLGKDDSTPTGVWMVQIHNKIKNPTYYSPRGEGVIDSKDPANPLGSRWLGLTGIDGHAVGKTSYGIHGTIHPETVGKMESMGCIRLKNEDVEQLFDLLTEGKSIVVVKD